MTNVVTKVTLCRQSLRLSCSHPNRQLCVSRHLLVSMVTQDCLHRTLHPSPCSGRRCPASTVRQMMWLLIHHSLDISTRTCNNHHQPILTITLRDPVTNGNQPLTQAMCRDLHRLKVRSLSEIFRWPNNAMCLNSCSCRWNSLGKDIEKLAIRNYTDSLHYGRLLKLCTLFCFIFGNLGYVILEVLKY